MAEETESDKDFKVVTAMAKRLGLSGTDLDDYIHKHMRGLGYKSKRSYYKDKETSTGGGFFGSSRRRGNDDDDDDDM